MPTIKGPITEEGGLVRISIGWSYDASRKLRLARRAVPVRLEANASLDTGAEVSCLDSKLIEELELPEEGWSLANVPSLQDVSLAFQYDASLAILHPSGRRHDLLIADLPVMELPLNVLGYQAIIGRDVLSRCLLLYSGIGARFALKY